MMQFELGWNHLGSLNLVIRDFFEPRFDRCEPMRLAAMGTADFGEDLAETCKARRIDVESGGHFMPRRGADEKESRLTFAKAVDQGGRRAEMSRAREPATRFALGLDPGEGGDAIARDPHPAWQSHR